MSNSPVTVVVVPRERFSFAKDSLESIYEHTRCQFNLVYIDGGSPKQVKYYLRAKAQQMGFTLIRRNYYLSPNEARNLGLRHADSKYVVFIDNDVLVTPGWLEHLVQCAEDTSAWVVGPLYFKGAPGDQVIHLAGGIAHIKEDLGQRSLVTKYHYAKKPLREVPVPLRRLATGLAEFHCMLVRTDVFERLSSLDEQLLSTSEHIDFCLAVQEAGGSVYFEPNASVTYVPPTRLAWSDYPFFMVRWSDAWNLTSVNHFFEKWHLDKKSPKFDSTLKRRRNHRYLFLEPLRRMILYFFGRRLARRIEEYIVFPLEKILNWCVVNSICRNHSAKMNQT